MKATICAVLLGAAIGAAAAQEGGPVIASEGDWTLRNADRGTGCVLAPKERSRIQISDDRLDVTGLPKNSIFNYQFRIDDKAVSTATLPTPAMQEAGVISLGKDVVDAVLSGERFSIRILDRWHEAITEDISLKGLRALHDRMAQACKGKPGQL